MPWVVFLISTYDVVDEGFSQPSSHTTFTANMLPLNQELEFLNLRTYGEIFKFPNIRKKIEKANFIKYLKFQKYAKKAHKNYKFKYLKS